MKTNNLQVCQRSGCERRVPDWHRNRCCCLHDGMHEPVVCHCPVARPDDIGQCTRCWRVIVALHPILHDAWPELADQPIQQQDACDVCGIHTPDPHTPHDPGCPGTGDCGCDNQTCPGHCWHCAGEAP